jgi:predicted NAD-dependent protein-ADP-ribosyltransferase YbiA (DUF1768 family)
MGGAREIIYFYETFAENMIDETDDKEAIDIESKIGFLSNYYTCTSPQIRQAKDESDFDKRFLGIDNLNKASVPEIEFFMWRGHKFANSEQAFCFAKACFFDPIGTTDAIIAAKGNELIELILATYNPDKIKKLGGGSGLKVGEKTVRINFKRILKDGRQAGNFDSFGKYLNAAFEEWAEVSMCIMIDILTAKFHPIHRPQMNDMLMATGNKLLAEAAPGDFIWGIGYAASEEGGKPEYAADDKDEMNPMWYKNENGKKVKAQNKLGEALMIVRSQFNHARLAEQ